MKSVKNTTLSIDSLNENMINSTFQNAIYQSIEADEYQYDIEMELNWQVELKIEKSEIGSSRDAMLVGSELVDLKAIEVL